MAVVAEKERCKEIKMDTIGKVIIVRIGQMPSPRHGTLYRCPNIERRGFFCCRSERQTARQALTTGSGILNGPGGLLRARLSSQSSRRVFLFFKVFIVFVIKP